MHILSIVEGLMIFTEIKAELILRASLNSCNYC
jgi:hypothetical protein